MKTTTTHNRHTATNGDIIATRAEAAHAAAVARTEAFAALEAARAVYRVAGAAAGFVTPEVFARKTAAYNVTYNAVVAHLRGAACDAPVDYVAEATADTAFARAIAAGEALDAVYAAYARADALARQTEAAYARATATVAARSSK